jgi:hypothetical protein
MKSFQGIEFWTSGTGSAGTGVNFWASTNKKIINKKMSWTDVSSGDCFSVQYFNGSSTFSKVECEKELNFICEVSIFSALKISTIKENIQVRNSGTFAQGLQNECMEVWNITIGMRGKYWLLCEPLIYNILAADMLVFDDSYDASSITLKLKVHFYRQKLENYNLFLLLQCFIKCIGENLELVSSKRTT